MHVHNAQFELFWSYKAWLAGDKDLGNEIMANVVMFVPFGFLFSSLLPSFPRSLLSGRRTGKVADSRTGKVNASRTGKVRTWVCVVIAAAIFSLLIETLQFFLMRGLCEFDDVVSNTLGAVIGIVLYAVVKRWKVVPVALASIFTISCLLVIITGKDGSGVDADITPRMFCFQVAEVQTNQSPTNDLSGLEHGIELSGFAFRYEHETKPPTIILRSMETGKRVKLETMQTERPDVNEYFLCEHDYTMSGFTARGQVEDEEYELMIQWPWTIPLSTGLYLPSSGSIRYTAEEDFTAPDVSNAPDLKSIVEEGLLRVYRPDFHCWVYQKDWSLYWIVEPGFNFEDDGSTYIQYQLWTTQVDKLPEKRLQNNWFWDNIGGHFEKYELTGNFGSYRVMRREIPTAYSVTSIETGYYKNGEWIWKNFFRPVYKFEGGES